MLCQLQKDNPKKSVMFESINPPFQDFVCEEMLNSSTPGSRNGGEDLRCHNLRARTHRAYRALRKEEHGVPITSMDPIPPELKDRKLNVNKPPTRKRNRPL